MKKRSSLFTLRRYDLVIFSLLFPLFFGCHAAKDVQPGAPPEGKSALFRLAVLPFKVVTPEDHDATMLSCPACGGIFQADRDTQPEAGMLVQDLVLENLREQGRFSIASPDEAGAVYRRISVAAPEAPVTDIMKKTGAELGVDGVLVGYVFRYRERKGRWYSAEKPASVAFDFHLVRVSDGAVIWSGAFDRTQESLTENLFHLTFYRKWGIKWVTARELSEEGVAKIMKTFPGLDS